MACRLFSIHNQDFRGNYLPFTVKPSGRDDPVICFLVVVPDVCIGIDDTGSDDYKSFMRGGIGGYSVDLGETSTRKGIHINDGTT